MTGSTGAAATRETHDSPTAGGTVSKTALECRGLVKAFGGISVLRGVSLALAPGTVTALAGENGAGKSTLMKIVSGQVRPDAGDVSVAGVALRLADARLARELSVGIVPQELAPILDMTVYENLFAGRELKRRSGLLDRSRMAAQAREMLEVFGVDIDPQAPMRRLSVALRQIVEITKSTSWGARVVLLDEPTSAISGHEVERLYGVVETLRERGVTMLYTTHKMEEIRAIADRVVVLRDGAIVEDRPCADITDDEIVHAMIGRELTDLFPELPATGDEVALHVRDLQVAGYPEPVSFQVRAGEIVGLAGLVGAGRTELLEAVFGSRSSTGGEITVAGTAVRRHNAASSIGAGMALVPEDRKGAGLVLGMSVLDNATLPRLPDFSLAGWLRRRSRTEAVDRAMASVHLRSKGLGQQVGTLSGGNQQKVVLARWLTGHVKVLLLDEPTRGVDVGARSEIYRIVTDLAAAGMAVVMASSDMAEILGLAHRVHVIRDGAIAGSLDRTELSSADAQSRIFRLAAGLDGMSTTLPHPQDDAS
ncbi:sugar ABC transporter ATP-binding protein [Streptomyces sp. NBC_00038]|uniref:sugar ABC transporter ATP-binding protein n=1 Tax=Streptomyces sp. NBC_00038 TaxID=2903615 RepID=UPI002250BE82|nr:sugar ABC transporter ATP-binding protein [Streptomyces sp. NBC_00038]MCX5563001.1 sugar ABC transporter ATP-binding protein [Streptomyces sp. NBC_00038]